MRRKLLKSISWIRSRHDRIFGTKKAAGFMLTDILIVIVVLGLLAEIPIPEFQGAKDNEVGKAKAGTEKLTVVTLGDVDDDSITTSTVTLASDNGTTCDTLEVRHRGKQSTIDCHLTSPVEANVNYTLTVQGVTGTAIDGTATLIEPFVQEFVGVLPGQPTIPEPEDCTDGVDNDGDGAIDCRDTDCADDPDCMQGEIICDDGIDNDSDGSADCLDLDCDGMPCDASGNVCIRFLCGGL